MTNQAAIMLGSIAAVAVAGAVAYMIIQKQKENANASAKDVFGEPVIVEKFTLKEAKGWIMERKDRLKNGGKAAIMKLNDELMNTYGVKLPSGFAPESTLLLSFVENGKIVEGILVQYKTLDESLENLLSKGNGMLVVEG